MKHLFLIATLAAGVSFSANAQSQIVKERAKGVANTPPPAGNSSPAAAPRPLPTAMPANAQQHRIAKLKSDLAEVRLAGNVTDQAKRNFASDLLAIAQSSHRPSTNSVAALTDSLLPAMADRKIPVGLHDRLIQKLVVLMNSHGLSSTRTQEISEEARTALTSSGVSAEAAAQIAGELQAIAAEVQKSAGL